MKGAAKMKENKTIKIITMITGILTVLLGFYAVVRPMRTFLAIGWILGMLLFVNGIELVILSLSKEKKDIGGCILGVLEGLGGIILLFSGEIPDRHHGNLSGWSQRPDLWYLPDCSRSEEV